MGIYDQLANLPQTPTVAAPEAHQTVKESPDRELPASPPKPVTKNPRSPKTSPRNTEANPKLPIDSNPLRQRIITRASFEVYQDQVHVLRQVSLTAKLTGEKLSISEMVREALDSYLTDKNLK